MKRPIQVLQKSEGLKYNFHAQAVQKGTHIIQTAIEKMTRRYKAVSDNPREIRMDINTGSVIEVGALSA